MSSLQLQHDVVIAESRPSLDARVAEFAHRSVVAGSMVVVVSTHSALDAVDLTLRAAGLDPARLRHDGVLVCRVAQDTLAGLRRGHDLDWSAIDRLAGDLVRQAREHGRRLAVFGEMAALVWEAGHADLALELERHWHGLAATFDFELLCALGAGIAPPAADFAQLNAIYDLHRERRRDSASGSPLELRCYPPDASSVRAARGFVRATLAERYDDELVDRAVLITSELAANAIEHAASGYAVEVEMEDWGIRLGVRDRHSGRPVARRPGPESPSGRGVSIVAALSDRWDVTLTAEGKLVWATLPTTPPPPAHAHPSS